MNYVNQLPKKKLLFVINTSTYFSSLINTAIFCNKKTNFESIIYFDATYSTRNKDLEKCKDNNILFITREIEESHFFSALRMLKHFSILLPNISILKYIKAFYYYFYEQKFINFILTKYVPAIVILGGDIVGYNTSIFIKLAHKKNTPSVIIPQWMAGPNKAAEFILNNPDFSMSKLFNRMAGKLYPKWTQNYRGKYLICLLGEKVFMMQLFKLSPPNPWVLHSGHADFLALESLAVKKYCLSQGLPEKKLIVTGSIEHDIMYRVILDKQKNLKKLYQELNFEKEKPILLTALPPDFLYVKGGRPECEFTTYKELVKFWITSLTNVKYFNVLVSLHPSVSYDEMKYIEQWGAKIATHRIIKYIPLCDIFVASISATIQWAIICGIPVINYDVYKYRYHDYDTARGVVKTESKNEFIKLLNEISNMNYYQKLVEKQNSCKSQWGILDGKSGERINYLLISLLKDYKSS